MDSGRDRSLVILIGLALVALATFLFLGAPSRHARPMGPRDEHRFRRFVLPGLTVLLLAGIGVVIYGAERDRADRQWARELTGGDPDRAPALMVANGCAGCHTIPGVPGAHGLVGPPLSGLDERVYIAGVVENRPDNLVRWIRNARAIDPDTAMPSTFVSERDARDMAAYLYSLR